MMEEDAAPEMSASEWKALEVKLRARRGRGTLDQYWWAACRRASLAKTASQGSKGLSQHLALAAIFAGRGFRAGERELGRLTTYLELMDAAQSARCLPSDLLAVKAHIKREIRAARGLSEPAVLLKKARTIGTEVACFLLADAARFETLCEDESWVDDEGRRKQVEAGAALFVLTGADGDVLFRARIVSGSEHTLSTREYRELGSSSEAASLTVPTGKLRIGAPDTQPRECIVVDVEPGVYSVSMFNLDYGQKVVVVASRSSSTEAKNPPLAAVRRVGESCAGILELS